LSAVRLSFLAFRRSSCKIDRNVLRVECSKGSDYCSRQGQDAMGCFYAHHIGGKSLRWFGFLRRSADIDKT